MSRLRHSPLLLLVLLLVGGATRPAYPATAPMAAGVERDAVHRQAGPHASPVASVDRAILTDADPFHAEGLLNGAGASIEILAGAGALGRTVARALRALGSGTMLDVASGPAASRALAARRTSLEFTAELAAARSGIISSGSIAPPPLLF